MSALCIVSQTPEDDFDPDAECEHRLLCEVRRRRRASCRRSAGRHGDQDGSDGTTIEVDARLMRPVRLLCGDHALTDHAGLQEGERNSRMVERLIHTVWRTERLSHGSYPADRPSPSAFG
jgi:hypothetical protein